MNKAGTSICIASFLLSYYVIWLINNNIFPEIRPTYVYYKPGSVSVQNDVIYEKKISSNYE